MATSEKESDILLADMAAHDTRPDDDPFDDVTADFSRDLESASLQLRPIIPEAEPRKPRRMTFLGFSLVFLTLVALASLGYVFLISTVFSYFDDSHLNQTRTGVSTYTTSSGDVIIKSTMTSQVTIKMVNVTSLPTEAIKIVSQMTEPPAATQLTTRFLSSLKPTEFKLASESGVLTKSSSKPTPPSSMATVTSPSKPSPSSSSSASRTSSTATTSSEANMTILETSNTSIALTNTSTTPISASTTTLSSDDVKTSLSPQTETVVSTGSLSQDLTAGHLKEMIGNQARLQGLHTNTTNVNNDGDSVPIPPPGGNQ